MEKFDIDNPQKMAWGKLVKEWAKGERPRPANIEELKTQCRELNVYPIIPSYISGLVFVQNDKHILTIRLPPKDMVLEGEADLRSDPNADYPLPDFYQIFRRDPPPVGEEKVDLQAARIGEYSINVCA